MMENIIWKFMITLVRIWANRYMDQWEQVKFKTPNGMIYLSIQRDTQYPNSYNEIK